MQQSENFFRVGVFDSGIGGLTVLAACLARLPNALFFYLGDNGRAPYGSRPAEEIARFTEEGLSTLQSYGIDAAVLACNTATAVCLERMRAKFLFPIVGVEPAVKRAAEHCRRALVLATPRTAESDRLARLIARFPATEFEVVGLPRFAEAIEGYFTRKTPLTLSEHLPPFHGDGVVLGCTHYAFFRKEIADFYGLPTFDGGEGTAKRLASAEMVGRSDHSRPAQIPEQIFRKQCNNLFENRVIFLGKWAKLNKIAFTNKSLI